MLGFGFNECMSMVFSSKKKTCKDSFSTKLILFFTSYAITHYRTHCVHVRLVPSNNLKQRFLVIKNEKMIINATCHISKSKMEYAVTINNLTK